MCWCSRVQEPHGIHGTSPRRWANNGYILGIYRIKRRYVFFLYVKSVGNFYHTKTGKRHNSLHVYSVGLLFPYLFSKVFRPPSH